MTPVVICVCARAPTANVKTRRRASPKRFPAVLQLIGGRIVSPVCVGRDVKLGRLTAAVERCRAKTSRIYDARVGVLARTADVNEAASCLST
jgi:hypothetical protein